MDGPFDDTPRNPENWKASDGNWFFARGKGLSAQSIEVWPVVFPVASRPHIRGYGAVLADDARLVWGGGRVLRVRAHAHVGAGRVERDSDAHSF